MVAVTNALLRKDERGRHLRPVLAGQPALGGARVVGATLPVVKYVDEQSGIGKDAVLPPGGRERRATKARVQRRRGGRRRGQDWGWRRGRQRGRRWRWRRAW